MCGIIGITSSKSVANELYEGLFHLQHRGQDSAGIVTFDNSFHTARGRGYVREAFEEESLQALEGDIGIAHTRYTTAGSSSKNGNTQPFLTNSPYGIALVHNGNLTNYHELKKELSQKDKFHCNSESDTEVLLGVFASELQKAKTDGEFFETLAIAVDKVHERVKGAYSVIGIIAGKGMFAFRDPHGIRPLVYGIRDTRLGASDVVFSSENTMYTPLNFKHMGDVGPGELVFVEQGGKMHRKKLRDEAFTPCVFEYVYFARPDSIINNISVYRARLRMGQNLARRWKELHPKIIPDVVVPVPFSSNPIALSFAHELGVRYSEGLYKNSFVGRTFIMPGSDERKRSVVRKLSPQIFELQGKDVLLVDDSIVRGLTSRAVVELVRNAGANKVYFASACPPIRYPDFYGIDIPTRAELIAAQKSQEEIRAYMKTDILLYQTIEDLVEAVTRKGDHGVDQLSMPYLNGKYVAGNIDEKQMVELENFRIQERLADE